MECYRAVVLSSNDPVIQDKISHLNVYEDMLFISDQAGGASGHVISCLCPRGETMVLGRLSEEDTLRIRSQYGDSISMYIDDFGTYKRYDDRYVLWVELNISPVSDKGRSSLPLLIGVSAFTGALTLAVIAIRLVIRLKRKNL